DAVAEQVVRGESVESLLDAIPGGGGGARRTVQRYYGEHESLSPQDIGSLSDEDLREASSGTLAAVARGDEHALENRELVRYEMARRGIEEPSPVLPERQVIIEGLVWSDDATYVRWMVEQLFAGRF